MIKKLGITLMVVLMTSPLLIAQELRQGLAVGHYTDVAGMMTLDFENLNPQVPFSFGIYAGYSYQFDSGNAEDARQIFINDNAGGTIEKFGSSIMVGADFRLALLNEETAKLRLFAGPRGMFYQAHYAYVGDNEAFAVSSNQLGLGGGVQLVIAMGTDADLTISAGVSYFFPTTLGGHGEFTYSPDGVDDNPRNDYTWEDANTAVNQPDWEIPILFGFRWKL